MKKISKISLSYFSLNKTYFYYFYFSHVQIINAWNMFRKSILENKTNRKIDMQKCCLSFI